MGVQPRSKELKQTKEKQKVAVKQIICICIEPKRTKENKKSETILTENETEKANTKSVGYSSANNELVPVSFSTIVRVGASCRIVSNAKAIRGEDNRN